VAENINLPSPFEINITYEKHHGISGEEIFVAAIAFIVGSISSGFFAEIGKDIWNRIKSISHEIIKKEQVRCQKIMISIYLEYNGYPIQLSINSIIHPSSDQKKTIEFISHLLDDSVKKVATTISKIDSGSEYIRDRSTLHIEFDNSTMSWILK